MKQLLFIALFIGVLSCSSEFDNNPSTRKMNSQADYDISFSSAGDSTILSIDTSNGGWWISTYGTIINNDTAVFSNSLLYKDPVPFGKTNIVSDTIKRDFYTIIKKGYLLNGTELFIKMDKNNSEYPRDLYIFINHGETGRQLKISQQN